MEPIIKRAKNLIDDALVSLYPQAKGKIPVVMVMPASPKLEVAADYTCTTAMALSKILSQLPQADGSPSLKLNPMQVAESLAGYLETKLPRFGEAFEGITVTKPGFVNFLVRGEFARESIMNIAKIGVELKHEGGSLVIVDYSSPNIAKEMHVGHLRSTIIGDCVTRLLRYANYKVLGLNHVGDWGTQFGMLLALLFDRFGEDYAKFTSEIKDLQTFYKDAKKRFDEDEDFKKKSYDMVVRLQSKDDKIYEAWNRICDVSRREFNIIYNRLGVKDLVERGESFYQKYMVDVVKDLESRGLLVEDEGRKLLWPNEVRKKNEIPLTIVKSDGGFTYDTSDLAAVRQRAQEEKAERILYVVDNGQAVHFQTIFAAARRIGYVDSAVKLEQVGFGLVLGEDKKKFKTRSGDSVKLADLLDEGLQRSKAKLLEKNRQEELNEAEMKAAQEAVAYGCIRYADLSRDRNKDYVFSFDQMLEDKGNTAVYLLYSLTRIRSIKRKADLGSIEEILKKRAAELGESAPLKLDHEREIKLAKFLLRFPDIILQCIDDLLFHLLCNYLYELSSVFTEFYESCYCIEKNNESGDIKIHLDRIILCEVTAAVMDKGLTLLGLKTLDKM